jgi:hypothetical protein
VSGVWHRRREPGTRDRMPRLWWPPARHDRSPRLTVPPSAVATSPAVVVCDGTGPDVPGTRAILQETGGRRTVHLTARLRSIGCADGDGRPRRTRAVQPDGMIQNPAESPGIA